MLKVISHIILSLILLGTTMGMTVSKHYCGENLISVSINHEKEPCCSSGNCCHTETVLYQVKEDFSTPNIIHPPVQVIVDLFGLELNENLFTESNEEDSDITFEYEYLPPKPVLSVLAEEQSYLL